MTGHITTLGVTLLGICWAEFILALVFISTRAYSAVVILRRVAIDFYIASFTFTLGVGSIIFLTLSVTSGLAQHITTLTPNEIKWTLLYSWINQILAIFAIGVGKVAIVAYLVQIATVNKIHAWILWFFAISNLVINIITVGLILAQCSPTPKLFDNSISGTCNGRELNQHFAYFQGSWSALCDVVLALFPIVLLRNLQMPRRVKFGLCILMGVGLIAAVCAACKTSELRVLSTVSDVTYVLAKLIIWNTTEMFIVLIVGCIPPSRPFFAALFKRLAIRQLYTSDNTTGTSRQAQSYKLKTTSRSRATDAASRLDDNESEEGILHNDHGIVVTHEYQVTRDEEGREAEGGEGCGDTQH